jgi:hypothetical protein
MSYYYSQLSNSWSQVPRDSQSFLFRTSSGSSLVRTAFALSVIHQLRAPQKKTLAEQLRQILFKRRRFEGEVVAGAGDEERSSSLFCDWDPSLSEELSSLEVTAGGGASVVVEASLLLLATTSEGSSSKVGSGI